MTLNDLASFEASVPSADQLEVLGTDTHPWSQANDEAEDRMVTESAVDPLTEYNEQQLRDYVYRYDNTCYRGSSVLYTLALFNSPL